MFTPLKYDGARLSGIDPIITYSPNMIFPSDSAIGDIRHPTSDISLWISSLMTHNKTDDLGNLLTAFGIKYIILRGNVESQFLDFSAQGRDTQLREKWKSFDLESFLDQQTDLMKVEDMPDHKVYKNVNNSTKIFVPKHSIYGLTNFDDILHISQILPLNEVAVYSSAGGNRSLSSLLLDSEDEMNFSQENFIPLGQFVRTEDPARSWISKIDSFAYDYILSSRVNNGIFAIKPDSKISFQFPLQNQANQSGTLWAKVLEWNKGGEVNFNVNGETTSISLFSDKNRFRVVQIDTRNYSQPMQEVDISITNENGANYVEGIYYAQQGQISQDPSSLDRTKIFVGGEMGGEPNGILSNPSFSENLSAEGRLEGYSDPIGSCGSKFNCVINMTSGWEDDSTSFQISTLSTDENTWSRIYSNPVTVNSGERYEFVSHLKVNSFTQNSHIGVEGLDSKSGVWLQIEQCPSAVSGAASVDWNQFVCHIIVPEDMISMRIALNAGHSELEGEGAETQFDGLYLNRIGNQVTPSNLSTLQEFVNNSISSAAMGTSHVNNIKKIDPTLWNASISADSPFTLIFAEPYDSAWKATVYKEGKALQVVSSEPGYDSINSFRVDHGGELELVIKNARQDWFNIGLIISGISVVVCLYVALLQKKSIP